MTQEKTEHEIVEEMSQVVEQMRIDDLEDNPGIANEFFDCDCCEQNTVVTKSVTFIFNRA